MTIQDLIEKFERIKILAEDIKVDNEYDELNKNVIISICDNVLLQYKIEKRLKNVE
jgi:hypothetical protein